MFARLVLSALLANATAGHFCLMSMASATSMPVQHDEAMEMAMTPMEPMSPAHCEHCARLAEEVPLPMSPTCAGHCLSQAGTPAVAAAIAYEFSELSMALPPASILFAAPGRDDHLSIASTGPPVLVSPTRTIVLLQ